jgi:uncharacterized BrkB/YihY/UPF0761 family membrane protein
MYYDNSGQMYGIFWISLALVNAGLAETKNRSRLRWFLISLFVGPFATFLIVVWPKSTEPAPEPLHPIRSPRDRYLLLGTIAIVLFVVATIIAIAAAFSVGDHLTLPISAAVAVLSAVGFVVAMRAYQRQPRDNRNPSPPR